MKKKQSSLPPITESDIDTLTNDPSRNPELVVTDSGLMDLSKYRISDATFAEALAKKYVGASITTINKMAGHVSRSGLSVEEACLLEGLDYDKFLEHMDSDPLLKRLFLIKQLEYKKDLLKTLSDKAREGDKGIATWLAEKKYSNEYGKDSGKNTNDDDLLKSAIDFIRETTKVDDLIGESANKPTIINKGNKSASLDVRKYLK